ncbi:MAG TPA: TldD/PmbA family protein [Planctomycetota bacterium]|nr:TldD/PmbA family protein [Planctomycetota bacterium]
MPDLKAICHQAAESARRSGAGQAEAYAHETVSRSVKIEKNDIHLASSATSCGLGVRVFVEKALGFASTNSLDSAEAARAAGAAVTVARCTMPDEANELPEKAALPAVPGLHEEALAATTMAETLDLARTMLAAARDFDRRVTIDGGSVDVVTRRRAVVNTRGVAAEEISSHIIYLLMGMAKDGDDVSSFQFEFDVHRERARVDVAGLGRRLAGKVVATLGAGKGESFRGPVILSPDAAAEVLASPILFSADANMVQKGMSPFAGKLGQEVADARITVVDDGLLPGGVASSAFDREGVPHRPLTIVKDGTLQSYMYDTRTARRGGTRSTGHAVGGARSVPAIGPTNLTFAPGNVGKDEIIAGVDRGILVTRLSGGPDPVSGDLSGVVKGGFLIRKGEIAQPLTGTVIQANSYELLKKVTAVSRETETIYSFRMPYVRVEDVSVTSG